LGAIVISKRNRFDKVWYKTMLRAERAENFFDLSHICDILTARYWKMKSKICQINLISWEGNKKAGLGAVNYPRTPIWLFVWTQ